MLLLLLLLWQQLRGAGLRRRLEALVVRKLKVSQLKLFGQPLELLVRETGDLLVDVPRRGDMGLLDRSGLVLQELLLLLRLLRLLRLEGEPVVRKALLARAGLGVGCVGAE